MWAYINPLSVCVFVLYRQENRKIGNLNFFKYFYKISNFIAIYSSQVFEPFALHALDLQEQVSWLTTISIHLW